MADFTKTVVRKPLFSQAMQYTLRSRDDLIAWTGADHRVYFLGIWHEQISLTIPTKEVVRFDDWVVLENGVFHVFKDHEFQQLFFENPR